MIPQSNETATASPQYSFDESNSKDGSSSSSKKEKKSPLRLLTVTKPKRSSSPLERGEADDRSAASRSSSDDEEIAEIIRFLKDLDKKEKKLGGKQMEARSKLSCEHSRDLSSLNYSEGSTEGSPLLSNRSGSRLEVTTSNGSAVSEHSSLSSESWTTGSGSKSSSKQKQQTQQFLNILGEQESSFDEDGGRNDSEYGLAPVTESSNPSTRCTTPTMENLNTNNDTAMERRASVGNDSPDTSNDSVSTPVPSSPILLPKHDGSDEDKSPVKKFHHNRQFEFGEKQTKPTNLVVGTTVGEESSLSSESWTTGSGSKQKSFVVSQRKIRFNLLNNLREEDPIVVHSEYGDAEEEEEEAFRAKAKVPDDNGNGGFHRWMCGLDLADAQSVLRPYFCFQ